MISLSRTWQLCGFLIAATLAAGNADFAYAQLTSDEELGVENEVVFHLGGGLRMKPRYEGADSYVVYPFPIIAVSVLRVPGLGGISGSKSNGFYAFPSFSYLGDRTAKDDPALAGLAPVDWAVEVGLGVGYRYGMLNAFVTGRRGFNGHTGWVFNGGLDLVKQISERWTVSGGGRVSFGDNTYMDTYFGVTPLESVTSMFSAYDPSGGIKSAGISGLAIYRWTDNVSVQFQLGYNRLVGDAGNSPIVTSGSKDQFQVGFGLTRRFALDLVK